MYRFRNSFCLRMMMLAGVLVFGTPVYNLLIAGSMFGILPILIIYLIFQRYLIDGMTSGAVKG